MNIFLYFLTKTHLSPQRKKSTARRAQFSFVWEGLRKYLNKIPVTRMSTHL